MVQRAARLSGEAVLQCPDHPAQVVARRLGIASGELDSGSRRHPVADGEQPLLLIDSEEIANQVYLTRAQPGADGNVHFSMKALQHNWGGLGDLLAQVYATPALVPGSPWLDDDAPPAPEATVTVGSSEFDVRIEPAVGDTAKWVVQVQYGRQWTLQMPWAS